MTNIITLTDDNFVDEIQLTNGLSMVVFSASWCGPCKMFAPTVEKISDQYKGIVKVGKMDIDNARTTAAIFNVMSVPTTMICRGAEILQQLVGVQKIVTLEKLIDSLL